MRATVRTFIAFELPAEILQYAAALQGQLQAQGLRLRWVRLQNMHLTLKFLGDMAASDIEKAKVAMQRAAQKNVAFELSVQGMGVFPGIRRPRVLWIGLGGQVDLLQRLHSCLEDFLVSVGFAKEERSFKAHLTLARIKEAVDSRDLLRAIEHVGRFAPKPFQARQMVLFRSDLRPQGPVYSPLAFAPLA